MFITRIHDQRCCTCNQWQGVRVTENDGYVYALKDVEGVCHDHTPSPTNSRTCMYLTFPSTSCHNWVRWNGLPFPTGKAPESVTHGNTFSATVG